MPGYSKDKGALVSRLRRIEGQVRGLQRMVQEDQYCIDILTQISAATKALNMVGLALLDDHMRECVREAVRGDAEGGDRILDEASAAIERFVTT